MANDLWQTPPEIFAAFNERFNFKIDLAADDKNAKCARYISEEMDAISMYWNQLLMGEWGWLNCPYSNPLPWVEKAIETQSAGSGVVMLLNNDPSVRWYRKALNACSEIWHFISNDEDRPDYRIGRIWFIDGTTGLPCKQNNKPQCAFIFDPHRIGDQQTRYVELANFERRGLELLNKNQLGVAA